jgi:hypothetical protein
MRARDHKIVFGRDVADTSMASLDDILASMKASAAEAGLPGASSISPTKESPTQKSGNSSDEDVVELKPPPLDDSHRVASTGASTLNYRFRSGTLRLTLADAEVLCADCSLAFALNSSNWLAATAAPRCALERLARAVFNQHTAGVDFDPERSGAEWWAQVRGGGHREEAIEFHWDVDEHFCDGPGGGLHVHPHISTVTYLTKVGAPTLGLKTRAPSSALEAAVQQVHGAVPSGFISWPRLGKHICFDGSLLHGAVPCRGHSAPSGERRVTFLVNVWLGHQPHAVEPLPEQLARSMRSRWEPHSAAFDGELTLPPKLRVEAPPEGTHNFGANSSDSCEKLQVAFGRNAKAHAIKVIIPPRPSSSKVDSYRLIFAAGAAEVSANTGGLTVRGPKPAKKKKKRQREE